MTTTVGRAGACAALGRTADGRPLPRARERLRPLVEGAHRGRAWGGPLLVTLIGGLLRFWHLGRPREVLFDETYYVKDAWSLLQFGYIRDAVDKADQLMLRGKTGDMFKPDTSFYVHPDVGKWLIAAGEAAFGLDPFGWRFSAALVGTLTILVLARLVWRLTGSVLLGSLAGLLLAVDGLHFVMSRMALLDVFVAFFLVCAVACLVVDRDWGRLRLARYLDGGGRGRPGAGFGPVRGLLLRPWRLLAGVCFGLAAGSKWSAVFVLGAFGLLVWAWDSSARKAIGVRLPALRAALVDAVPAFFSLVVVALVVYVATWAGWFAHIDRYETAFGDQWSSYAAGDASGVGEIGQSLDALWEYHRQIWAFHTGEGLRDTTHPYQSDAGGWLVINRPIGIAVENEIASGKQGCPTTASECIRQILAIGTPALWWGGTLALVVGAVLWLGGRDWRFGLATVGVLAGWVPWLVFDDRPIFYFYAVSIIPFTVVALTLVAGRILGSPEAPRSRRLTGAIVVGAFAALVVANFVFYYPIYTNGLLTQEDWLDRIWFTQWI